MRRLGILRGIRSESDYEYERTMRHVRNNFAEGIATYLDGRLLHDYLCFRVFETDLAAGNQQAAVDGLGQAVEQRLADQQFPEHDPQRERWLRTVTRLTL